MKRISNPRRQSLFPKSIRDEPSLVAVIARLFVSPQLASGRESFAPKKISPDRRPIAYVTTVSLSWLRRGQFEVRFWSSLAVSYGNRTVPFQEDCRILFANVEVLVSLPPKLVKPGAHQSTHQRNGPARSKAFKGCKAKSRRSPAVT